jgi:hypothetical protein
MTEHLSEREVSLFRDRTIGPTERARIDSHVTKCESCLRRILPAEDLALAYSEVTESLLPDRMEKPFHLSNKELRDYAGGTIDQTDRIIFESHLDICGQCSEALQSLAASPPIEKQSDSRSTKRSDVAPEEVSPQWRPAVLFTPGRAIAAALITACLLLALFVWQRRYLQNSDQTTRTSESPTPSVSPPSKSPTQQESEVAGADHPADDQSEIIATLKDNGRKIELDRTGKLIGLEELPEANRSLVRTALTAKSLPKPDVLDKLTAPSITLMDPTARENSFGLIGPLGTVIVSNHPNLRWKPLDGATSYTVSVFDADFNRVARSAPQAATQWTTPILHRGMIYSWEVVAMKDGQEVRSPVAPAPRAQFKVLEAEKLSELTNQKQHKPVSHLALGLTYARFGLLTEAEEQLQVLAKENPDSVIAKRLLQMVKNWQNR